MSSTRKRITAECLSRMSCARFSENTRSSSKNDISGTDPKERTVFSRGLAIVAMIIGLYAPPLLAQLHVAAPVVDLGEIRGGQKTGHRFELVNQGQEPIEILDIERGCGCVAARVERNRLLAGERTNLTVDL